MLSTKDDSSVEDNASSIGDSTWDLIDDGSVGTSDDEYHRLSRQQTPANDGQDGDDDNSNRPENLPGYVACVENGKLSETHCPPGEYPILAEVEAMNDFGDPHTSTQVQQGRKAEGGDPTALSRIENSQKSDVISFEELVTDESVCNNNGAATIAYAILELFEGPRLHQLSNALSIETHGSRILGTVRQTMASGVYQPDGPYKVLYIGAEAVKGPIIQKISSALVSFMRPNSRSNRSLSPTFSVIPVSAFGSQDLPEVVLVNSSGLQICVDHCMSAEFGKGGEDALYILLDDNETICSVGQNSPRVTPSSYVLPDLGVIYIEERETSSAKHARLLAHAFMKRHSIPCVLILACKAWMESSSRGTVNMQLPHLCVEDHSSSSREPRILVRLPVDLVSFMNIDPTQMSRSLAHVHGLKDTRSREMQKPYTANGDDQDELQRTRQYPKDWCFHSSPCDRLRSGPRLLAFLGVVLFSALMYLSLVRSVAHVEGLPFAANLSRPNSSWQLLPTGTTSLPSVTPAHMSPGSTAIPSHSGSREAIRTRSPDLSPTVIESNLAPIKQFEGFVIYIAEQGHIILQPPPWFIAPKKSPALAFSVFRGNESIDFAHAVSVNGTHTLKLQQDDACGTLNITAWTIRKPLFKESFVIDFGVSWPEGLPWLSATRLLTRYAKPSFDFARFCLQNLLTPTSLQAQFLAQWTTATMDQLIKELKFWLLALIPDSRELTLTGWRESINKLRQRPIGHSTRVSLTSKPPGELIAQKATTLMSSAWSLPRQWTQGNVEKVQDLSTFNVAGWIRQYRETHLIRSQILAVRLWWGIRGGLPLHTAELYSKSYDRKDDIGHQS